MLLDHAQRPLVIFNPALKEHRAHYANFLKTNTWGKCPVRFAVDGPDGSNNNLAYAMQRMLTEHYITKEFAVK
jgi:hypothetical protein